MRKLIVLLGLLAFSGTVGASIKTAGELLNACEAGIRYTTDSRVDADFASGVECVSYIAGFFGGATFIKDGDISKLPWKIMPTVTYQQLMKVYIHFANERPQFLHEAAALVFGAAMRNAFPNPDYNKQIIKGK